MKPPCGTVKILQGVPCTSSYWCDTDRAELARRMASRRHQQAVPSEFDVTFDPSLSATVSLRLSQRKKA